jgi:hypothetical protein
MREVAGDYRKITGGRGSNPERASAAMPLRCHYDPANRGLFRPARADSGREWFG